MTAYLTQPLQHDVCTYLHTLSRNLLRLCLEPTQVEIPIDLRYVLLLINISRVDVKENFKG